MQDEFDIGGKEPDGNISPLIPAGVGVSTFKEDVPIPVLGIFGFTVFPGTVAPISLTDEDSVSAMEQALSSGRFVFISILKEEGKSPRESIHDFGVVGFVLRGSKGPDNIYRAIVTGVSRARVENFVRAVPPLLVRVKLFEDRKPAIFNPEVEALMRQALELFAEYISMLPIKPPPEFLIFLRNIDIPGKLADFIASNLPLKAEEAQDLIETIDQSERLRKIISILVREKEVLRIQTEVSKRIHENIDKAQRIRILREEIREMQKELEKLEGVKSDSHELRERAEKLPEHAKKEVLKQLDRLESIPRESPEYTVLYNWIEEVLYLPWNEETQDNLDIKRAKDVLDEDHWNLDDVKERILEFLSVGSLKGEIPKGAILCLVGPPGVGKTSLGRSIARALGRKFVRISLGGVRDEAEIRGHRRTYVGAMPGRIMMGMKQAGSKNPVFMLDEIDKLSSDFRGDPASALLEVLDPEQNNSFVDHYISIPFDLSRVLFITTANITETIPIPLLDRMEVIHIPGYTDIDKFHIARKYFIPKGVESAGLSKYRVELSDGALFRIIREYTREAGVRELQRKIETLFRKTGKKLLLGELSIKDSMIDINEKMVEEFLGPPEFSEYEDVLGRGVGVVTGLAWTPFGGDILKIEVAIVPGKGGIILTGSLGDVMKESAEAAITYARVNAKKFSIDSKKFKNGIHVHVPEGAVPKDGPSAGVAICVALISALSGIPVRQDIAMTGEITLRGKILPVGGIREKVLAAERYGVKEVIIPSLNKNDLMKIPEEVKSKIKFHFVQHLDEVSEILFGGRIERAEKVDKKKKAGHKKIKPKNTNSYKRKA